MSLLKELINETAAGGATGAGAVAAAPGSLFAGGVVKGRKTKKLNKIMRLSAEEINKTIKARNTFKWHVIKEMIDDDSETFDAADVFSKLDAAQKRSENEQDTVAFGLEDEDGTIIKVYVNAHDAEEFEDALAMTLSAEDENGDYESSPKEIAEVLFLLKDKFEIVDVVWPEIEGDEEQEMQGDDAGMEGEDPGMESDDANMDVDVDVDAEGDIEMGSEGDDLEMEPDDDAKSALQQVIDVLKADAEAKKAEAEAKEAEAEAKEAEYNAQAAAAKVSQEEQVLDMEAYYKDKKNQDDEAKRLAKLAKYQHDKASDAEAQISYEDEEDTDPYMDMPPKKEDETMTKDELMTLILKYLQAN